MRGFTIATIIGVLFMFTGCKTTSLESYKGTTPVLDIKEYFNGPIKAWGVVHDWRGRVVKRFDIDMVREWQGDEGTLKEQFHYYDGEKQQRQWNIRKRADGTYEGRASDVLDVATSRSEGAAVIWKYTMDLPVGDTTYHITFDDRMWLMHDGVLINRSYMKKFGVTVAELTIFMQKQHPPK